MKKLFIITLLSFQFFSCSTSSSDEPQEEQFTTNGTLLRKSISTIDSEVSTAHYFYIGNKIQKVVGSNGTKMEYTYTGNLITKMDYFENNVLKNTEFFQYNSEEKMKQRKSVNYSTNKGYRCEYTYNSDGTVSLLGYDGDFTTQTTQIVDRKAFLFPNGDVEKIEEYTVSNGNPVTKTNYYTYDNKNSTSNSILGMNKIKHWDSGTSGNSHNNTSVNYTSTEPSFTPYINSAAFTYNSFNYPITASFFGINVQYFYQQN